MDDIRKNGALVDEFLGKMASLGDRAIVVVEQPMLDEATGRTVYVIYLAWSTGVSRTMYEGMLDHSLRMSHMEEAFAHRKQLEALNLKNPYWALSGTKQ